MTDKEKIAQLRAVPACENHAGRALDWVSEDECDACALALFAAVERVVIDAIRARKEPGQ